MVLISFAMFYMVMVISVPLKNWVWCIFASLLLYIIIIFAVLESFLSLVNSIKDRRSFSVKIYTFETLKKVLDKLKEYKKILVYILFGSTLFQIQLGILYFFFPEYGFLIFLLLFFNLLYLVFTKKIHPIFLFPFIFINILSIIFMGNTNNMNNVDTINNTIKNSVNDNMAGIVACSPVEDSHFNDDFETAKKKFFADKVVLAVNYPQIDNFDSYWNQRTLVPSHNRDGTFSQRILFQGQNSNVYNCILKFNTTEILRASSIRPIHPNSTFINNCGVARGYSAPDGFGSIPIKLEHVMEGTQAWYEFLFKCRQNGGISIQLRFQGNQAPPSIAQRGRLFLKLELLCNPIEPNSYWKKVGD